MAKRISAEEFDRIFDEGNEDIVDYLDLDKAVVSYPDLDTDLRRVNVDFPEWMIDELDREAKRIGINRQAVIKTWIAERIDRMRVARSAEVEGVVECGLSNVLIWAGGRLSSQMRNNLGARS